LEDLSLQKSLVDELQKQPAHWSSVELCKNDILTSSSGLSDVLVFKNGLLLHFIAGTSRGSTRHRLAAPKLRLFLKYEENCDPLSQLSPLFPLDTLF